MTKFYLELENNPLTGELIHSYAQCPDDAELPEHAECWVPRLAKDWERWDVENQYFVIDEAGRAKHEMGEAAVAEMRGRKLAQAEMVLAGLALPDGALLQREADLREISLQAMADIVIAKADVQSKEDAEIARQLASMKEPE